MKHIFDKCKSVIAKYAKGGGVGASLKDINKALYDALFVLFEAYIGNDGTLDYNDKDYGYINDELDYFAVKYYNESPDGDYQEELANDGEPNCTDEQAYLNLVTRFSNTRIDFENLKFEKGKKSIKDVNEALRKVLSAIVKSGIGSAEMLDKAHMLNRSYISDEEEYNLIVDFLSQDYFAELKGILKFEKDGSVDSWTDKKMYELLQDMGYDYGKYKSKNYDGSGMAEMAINEGYKWDEKKHKWFKK